MVNKIDSNFTGLRYTLEVRGSPKTLPGDPAWLELEPNSYADFGATTTLKARNPIVANRQQRKGRVVDIEAKAGFSIDFTSDNMLELMPCFFFADWRKASVAEIDAPTSVVAYNATGPVAGAFDKVASFGGKAVAGSLISTSGFTNAANNGIFQVSAVAADSLSVTSHAIVAEAGPPATSVIKVVGFVGAAGDLTIDASNAAAPALLSTVFDFTTLELIPGQWVYIGGDAGTSAFADEGNNGFARIQAISAHRMTFDKTQNTMVTDNGAGQSIEVFMGDFLKNENDPTLIVTQTIQLERSLSSAGFQYLPGTFCNELTIDMKSADKIELAMTFISLTEEDLDYGDRKTGTFPDIATDPEAYNTSSDLIRIRSALQGTASPLFAFMQTMSLKIANNVSPLKALGVLGAFDTTIGDFIVSGDITAYFSDLAAVEAVRLADSVSVDFVLALDNRGWLFDIPELTFDKGTLTVTKDQPITIPVGINAAEDDTLKTTLMATYFSYLPDAATA
jgi:hypothetical protein